MSSARQSQKQSIIEMFAYFAARIAASRRDPSPDLLSHLANVTLDGEQLPDLELFSLIGLLVVAGHETTRGAAAGGIAALLDHPGEWQRLRAADCDLDRAVEEILRFVSPVIQFARTPLEDVELRGERIAAGEPVVLFYPSANRDEAIFEEPDRFRLERHPNPHLAFGIGEHFCLGSHLARLELRALLEALRRRVASLEPAGRREHLASSFVGGLKHLPVSARPA